MCGEHNDIIMYYVRSSATQKNDALLILQVHTCTGNTYCTKSRKKEIFPAKTHVHDDAGNSRAQEEDTLILEWTKRIKEKVRIYST